MKIREKKTREQLLHELADEKSALSMVLQAATLYNYARAHEDRIQEIERELASLSSK